MRIVNNEQKRFDTSNIELGDFDKWAIEARIKQENRRWVSSQVFKAIAGIAIGLFIAKAMRGG